jgi:hypothetical protein
MRKYSFLKKFRVAPNRISVWIGGSFQSLSVSETGQRNFRRQRGKNKKDFTPDDSGVKSTTPRFHPACIHTDAARVLCNGRSRPGLLSFRISAGGSKAVTVPFPTRAAHSQWQPLSVVLPGQRPFPSLLQLKRIISPLFAFVKAAGGHFLWFWGDVVL